MTTFGSTSPATTFAPSPDPSPIIRWKLSPISRGSPSNDPSLWLDPLADFFVLSSPAVDSSLDDSDVQDPPLPPPPLLVASPKLEAPMPLRPLRVRMPGEPVDPSGPHLVSPISERPNRQLKLPPEMAKTRLRCLTRGCNKNFDRRSTWEKHMRSHTSEKPHECEFCQKAFGLKSNLTRHQKTCKSRPKECQSTSQTSSSLLPPSASGPSQNVHFHTPLTAPPAHFDTTTHTNNDIPSSYSR